MRRKAIIRKFVARGFDLLQASNAMAADVSGTALVFFAVLTPVLFGMAGLAVDYGYAVREKATLQAAADAAALAGAKELSLSDAKRENIQAVVSSVVESFIRGNKISNPTIQTAISEAQPPEVAVTVSTPGKSFFGTLFRFPPVGINVNAVARIAGQPNICVLALDPQAPAAVSLAGTAKLTGNNCAVFSNSTSAKGIVVSGFSQIRASTICSAGGSSGAGNMSPAPYSDCPQFEDPLADRPEPTAGGCDYTAMKIFNEDQTLKPGVYCQGLTILGLSRVTFAPGIYVIKDGKFLVGGSSQIVGDGVGFSLQGSASFVFDPLTVIDLAAPRDGPMAGLLFFGSRTQDLGLADIILSSNAQKMLGTIYLPNATLIVEAAAQVGGNSAYTAIVARDVNLLNGPNLVLNSDYADTDVPVPDGIKSAGQPISLVR